MSKLPKRIQDIKDNRRDYVAESKEDIIEIKKFGDKIEEEVREVTKQIARCL